MRIPRCKPCAGGYFSEEGVTSCSPCERGYHDQDWCTLWDPNNPNQCLSINGDSGQTACVKCNAGKVAALLARTKCDECPTGKYTDDLNVLCQPCPAGWYDHDADTAELSSATPCIICVAGSKPNKEEGADECSLCGSGRFSAQNGSVTCDPCDFGTFAAEGATECIDCALGYADLDLEPGTQCQYCSPGEFAPVKSVNCTLCVGGQYDGDARPETACLDCAGGKFSNPGQLLCQSCEAGLFAAGGSPSCTLCVAGHYSLAEASSCILCDEGQYAPIGSTACTDCPIGQSDDDTCSSLNTSTGVCDIVNLYSAATPCVLCPEGHFSTAKSTTCPECVAGRYDDDRNAASQCVDCQRGQYDLHYGWGQKTLAGETLPPPPPRVSCSLCHKGKYLNALGATMSTECLTCEENSWASYGAPTCTACPSYLRRDHTYIVTLNRSKQVSLAATPHYANSICID